MVPWLPVRRGGRLHRHGGGAGAQRRVWGDDHAVSGVQSLAEGHVCRGG